MKRLLTVLSILLLLVLGTAVRPYFTEAAAAMQVQPQIRVANVQCWVENDGVRGFSAEARNIGSEAVRAHLVVQWTTSDGTMVAASSVYLTRGLFGPLLVPEQVVRFGTSAYGYTRPSDVDYDPSNGCSYEIRDSQGNTIPFVET